MRALTVLYDARCGFCCWAKSWLMEQPQYVKLEFVPLGTEAAYLRFPKLDHESCREQLTVVGDGGEVWRGAKAWVMCLWSLYDFRSLALRLERSGKMALAERYVRLVSRHRSRMSAALLLKGEEAR